MKLGTVAVDYDGTLTLDGRLSRTVLEAICRVRTRGIRVLLVTGRRLAHLAADTETGMFDAVVAENGAVVEFPATGREVDLERLGDLARAHEIRLADEAELRWLYPDCELGAMPPFGPLYKQPVYVDEELTLDDEIVFNAGTHSDAICMRYGDFAALTRPIVGRFAERVLA